jgi:hypothetical protein
MAKHESRLVPLHRTSAMTMTRLWRKTQSVKNVTAENKMVDGGRGGSQLSSSHTKQNGGWKMESVEISESSSLDTEQCGHILGTTPHSVSLKY